MLRPRMVTVSFFALSVAACGSEVRDPGGDGGSSGDAAAATTAASTSSQGPSGPTPTATTTDGTTVSDGTGAGDATSTSDGTGTSVVASSTSDGTGAGDATSTSDSTSTGTTDASSSTGGTSCLDGALGTYLLALSTELDRTKPLYFRATVQWSGELGVLLQPLVTPYRDAAGAPMADAGPDFPLESVFIGSDGALIFATGDIEIDGAANPFSPNDLGGDFTLRGTACPSADGRLIGLYCGTLEGSVTSPISLELDADQNSFAFNEYQIVEAPEAYDCEGSAPDPF